MTKKSSYEIIRNYPKILLTGGTGQLGLELRQRLRPLGEVWTPTRKYFDLANPESLRQKVKDYQPNLIINLAAYTKVDQAELEPILAHSINTEAPRVLAEEAHSLGIPLIHYSTDYVFDGKKNKPYTESDKFNPLSVYGKTKLEGERAIQKAHDKYLILRTSWLYSSIHGNNFYTTMLRLFREKEVLKVVNDQIGSPTSLEFLAKATVEIISQLKTKGNSEDRWGVYHLSGEEQMSWYDFAIRICTEAGESELFKTKKILPISSAEYSSEAARPNYSALNCEQIQQKFGNIHK